jgi:helicase
MKYELPNNHGLSDLTLNNLVFKEKGQPALSDIQFAALEIGVGRGESALVLSPTSTGKTQIALWAIAKSLENRGNTVYLVTHRALAKQKFEDFKSQLLSPFLKNDNAGLIIATGDYVEDVEGNIPKEPLRAPLVVATYEKYLALLSASGIPNDMKATTIVCDEIQLIGDEHRGQHVEVLLTLLRNAGWKQFVGLSAVLEKRDAQSLANWLKVKFVVQHTREKQLKYECWTPRGIAVVNTDNPEDIEEGLPVPSGINLNTVGILNNLLKEKNPPVPIIVFCMRKQDTYELPEQLLTIQKVSKGQLLLPFEELPETTATGFLSGIMSKRLASHNADLTEEERQIVEKHLQEGNLDVVFATSTLAAGVNFPLGAAIFASWSRYNFSRRTYVAIEPSEFHNMAGRVGRMGHSHEQGRVIFVANNQNEIRVARRYLNLGDLPSLKSRITKERFNQLALQLIGSGLCCSRKDVEHLVCTTLSALREKENNIDVFNQWAPQISAEIDTLIKDGLLVEMTSGQIITSPVGKAISQSGLLPETGVFLLKYISEKAEILCSYLPSDKNKGDINSIAFLLFTACFYSPEFQGYQKKPPTRYLPYQLNEVDLFNASKYANDIVEKHWRANKNPVNSASICCDWMNGRNIRELESLAPEFRAGVIREMCRNLAWCMQGLSLIVTVASDNRVDSTLQPTIMQKLEPDLGLLARLPRLIRRLSFRISEGLPDDVLWMTSLNSYDSKYRLVRHEILKLKEKNFTTPEQIMLGSEEADDIRKLAFERARPTPQAKANWLRDSCKNWKADQRRKNAERHLERARRCKHIELIKKYYETSGTDFESTFENILNVLSIAYEKLDKKTKTGAPDYLIKLQDSPQLVVEVKTKKEGKLVNYNEAVEVLAASEVHRHGEKFCITLCHPGVDPSVPLVIASCGRLSVVESADLGEALLRLCEGSLTQIQLWQWLASPGQALVIDLPFREYD